MSQDYQKIDELLNNADIGFPDGQQQGNTARKIRDLIVSLSGVGGGDGSTANQDGTPRGLIRLGARRYQVDERGDGFYLFVGQGNANVTADADVSAQFIVNDVASTANYTATKRFISGDKINNGLIVVDLPAYDGWPGTGNRLREGDIIELTFDVSGASLNDVDYYIFGVRLGGSE